MKKEYLYGPYIMSQGFLIDVWYCIVVSFLEGDEGSVVRMLAKNE